MKIRSGFVSNSSSSSFIVRFPKDPTNIDTLREMMGECAPNCGYSWLRQPTSEEVVQRVHKDLGGHKGNSFDSFYDDNRYNYEYEEKFQYRYDCTPSVSALYDNRSWYELTDNEKDALVKMWLYEIFITKYGNQDGVFIYEFTYSDECGDFEAQLEHGQIFRNIDHDIESHH